MTVALLGLCLLAAAWPERGDAQKQMYRWVDEQGEVQYTDQPPPAQLEQDHTPLNEVVVRTETIPPPPTEEELRQAKEQERLQAEAAQRIAQQKAADEALLQTYRTIDDLLLAGKGRIAAIEAPIQAKRDAMRPEQDRLAKLYSEKTALERAGKSVPASLADSIAQSEKHLRESYAFILEQTLKKGPVRHEFVQNAEHYRMLKKLPAPAPSEMAADPVSNDPVSCQGAEQCGQYWQRAMDYFRAQTNPKEEIAGPGLLLSWRKDEREDRRFALVWIQKSAADPVYLYFDLDCRERLTARPCSTEQDQTIRDGFRAAVMR
jgi:hypothetical protein